jgi:putative spermidine/putrescine transport system ATP-binding protein
VDTLAPSLAPPSPVTARPQLDLELRGIRKRFGDFTAIDGVSLKVKKGQFVCLLGPSGCGKTTALRILGGFDRPDAGRVLVDDRDITKVPPNKRDMGMVFQAYSLFPNMDVRTNVAFGLRMRHQNRATRLKRANELLELVGLAETGDRYPYQLSGGQQQRVAIARALAIEPTVLLLDEPLSALDARVRTQLRAEIRSLQQRLGITTLFVTHDQSEALSIADRVGVMRSGRLEQLDTPENVYRRPTTQFVAEFVGAMNRLPGRIGDNNDVQVLGQRLTVLNPNGHQAGEVVDALLRPEALEIVPDSAGPATVTDRTFLGSAVRLEVKLDTGEKVLVESSSLNAHMKLGARSSMRILTDAVVVAPPEPEAETTARGDGAAPA